MPNPLLSDRDVDFLLYELVDAPSLCALPAFADHARSTFDLVLASSRRLAREVLFPAYKPMDAEPPRFIDGRIHAHPIMKQLYPQLAALDLVTAARPVEVGGQSLPLVVTTLASAYLMAANLSAYCYFGLTAGAAHLIETFGSEWLRREFMARLHSGEWTGTMALTEPQAGSSLSDVKTRATPMTTHGTHGTNGSGDANFRLRGSKIFISGGDHDLTDNIVHMVLARIDGAPAGTKGISLFAVPRRRFDAGGALVDNDVSVAGMIHKIGWRGLPSLALEFGERDDCHGWLVGEAGKGLACMFQMMNEARIMVGVNAVATASVAYQAALAYARERPQGRSLGARDPTQPQVPIIEHADVRRMLLRQKAIVEGGLALIVFTALQADLAAHAATEEERLRAGRLLDLLTPVAKSFPAEKGYESNTLALQIHGGYGYSSEFLVEAWLRDQKLNSIHEGTTGIHAMDLVGRKVMAQGGAALHVLAEEMARTITRAERAGGVEAASAGRLAGWAERLEQALRTVEALTLALAQKGLGGDVEGMMRHSADYLELFSIVVVAWQWLAQAVVATERLGGAVSDEDRAFYEGKRAAAQYWFATEVPRVGALAELCGGGDDSYARMRANWF